MVSLSLLGMGIDKNFTIPIQILLIDPIPYRFSYRFSLGEKISTNVFVCIKSLEYLIRSASSIRKLYIFKSIGLDKKIYVWLFKPKAIIMCNKTKNTD